MTDKTKETIRLVVEVLREMGQLQAQPDVISSQTVPRVSRPLEKFDGDRPTNADGKFQIAFMIKELCGVDDRGKKCKENLHVICVKRSYFERDSTGMGGQLMYDEKDVTMFKYCPIHIPSDFIGGT